MASAGWYARRLSRMGPAEIAERVRAGAVVAAWRRAETPDGTRTALVRRAGPVPLPAGSLLAVDAGARERLLSTASELMDGHFRILGVARLDLANPDWSWDPRTGRRAPQEAFAFDVRYRDPAVVGDVKQLWELSRHHHLTVLAAAYACTGDDAYAARVADHLKSWWAANPPRRGVHWISGIELGIRLVSWVWVRRLLDGWPGAPGLFEENPEAVHQIWHHQAWLAALPSVGSSANNHAVAEAAGRFVASCAFGWFDESARWRREAAAALGHHLGANTFPSGVNREQAGDYHGLVLELGLLALAEADASGTPLPPEVRRTLVRMADALAATVDCRLRPPRQGDSDDGCALVVDGGEPGEHRSRSLLATTGALFGRRPWWPDVPGGDVRTAAVVALCRRGGAAAVRPAQRPDHFADAGLTVLRRAVPGLGEVWCRCDGGPHGFGSIAAHAHADALSVEVRLDGVDVLADPGTYAYHTDPEWRAYFRSTVGHNTLELDGTDQSTSGGPFLWVRHARSRVLVAHSDPAGAARWAAEHDGYLRSGVRHRRTVVLDPADRSLLVRDELRHAGSRRPQHVRLAFHTGPLVGVELAGSLARLRWSAEGRERAAELALPGSLAWTAHRGETHPPLGWYSPAFGRREPAWSLVGTGRPDAGGASFVTRLRFLR